MRGHVIAGVDGSPASLSAVEHAAGEARLRGADLTIVHALTWPHVPAEPGPPLAPHAGVPEDVDLLPAEAEERARTVAPAIRVTCRTVHGDPLTALAERSQDAALLVVGHRGRNTFTGLLIGSVALHLAAHAHCPIMIVRGRPHPGGPVLLGVDGSGRARAATAFAFDEASLRGTELLALHAWSEWHSPPSPPRGPFEPYARKHGELPEEGERLIAEALSGHNEHYPEVRTQRRTVRGRPRETLLTAAREAQLMVVGARGLGGFAGLLLGSVSQAVIQHADCPVVVVPADTVADGGAAAAAGDADGR